MKMTENCRVILNAIGFGADGRSSVHGGKRLGAPSPWADCLKHVAGLACTSELLMDTKGIVR